MLCVDFGCRAGRDGFYVEHMLAARQILGERGEAIAERFLITHGWTILARRFRSGHRDIDLVAQISPRLNAQRTVAFVEVKARVSSSFGGPLGAVHWRKQRELTKAARDWIGRFRQAGDTYRFDVVGVIFGSKEPEIIHIENAFSVK